MIAVDRFATGGGQCWPDFTWKTVCQWQTVE